jgi:hypothetical protein
LPQNRTINNGGLVFIWCRFSYRYYLIGVLFTQLGFLLNTIPSYIYFTLCFQFSKFAAESHNQNRVNMNLMSVAEVTFWHYWLFLLLQEIRNPVERLRTKYNDHDNEDKLSDLHDENEDKLSDLPDCVLLHILSFLNTKYAVQTCILSKRWKNVWKCLPSLIICYSHFKNLRDFEYFIHWFLGTRDRSTALEVLIFVSRILIGIKLVI